MKESPNGAGPLRKVLESAASGAGCSLGALTVLSCQRDPYRLDTPAGHRDGEWFAQQVQRFLGRTARVHLRGLHYRISASADVRTPNGLPYTNTDENWEWLTESAANAGRWLGYVPFERIIDERNAPPEIYVTEAASPQGFLSYGQQTDIPLSVNDALPKYCLSVFGARQAYRIFLFGEKYHCATFFCRSRWRLGASYYYRPASRAIQWWPSWRREHPLTAGLRWCSISVISIRQAGR